MQIRQDITVGGHVTAAQYQYTLQDGSMSAQLIEWAGILRAALCASCRRSATSPRTPRRSPPRRPCRSTAIPLAASASPRRQIDDTLYDAFGQRQIATLFTQLNQYHVIEEVLPRYQLTTDSLRHLYVRSALPGSSCKLSVLVEVKQGLAPITINHQGLFPAITLSFNLAPGYGLGDAVNAIRAVQRRSGKPSTLTGSFQGTAPRLPGLAAQPAVAHPRGAARRLHRSRSALREPIHPLTIISTLPSAGVGALVALSSAATTSRSWA